MGKRFTCARGHPWEADGHDTDGSCPVCGAEGVAIEAVTLAAPGVDALATMGHTPAPLGEVPALPEAYEVLGELGRGGMGVVYQARDKRLGRVVALKMLLSGSLASEEERQRFLREASAIAHLRHPHILAIHEIGEAPGKIPYFTLEFCPNGSLADRVGKPWPPREAALLVETLARAVQAAHDKQVIHRDLKPANVLFAEDESPRIGDFGLARRLDEVRQTTTGTILGTPAYMAPEQASGKANEIGPATDVYALGAILYEMLTGTPPFHSTSAAETILSVLKDEPARPSQRIQGLPRDVETICLKCLHKEREQRYASATELVDDLRAFQQGEPIRARRSRRWRRVLKKHRWLIVSVVLGSLILAGIGVRLVLMVQGQRYSRIQRAFEDAYRLRNQGKHAEAIAAFDVALRYRPDYAPGYAHRGLVHQELKNYEEALHDFDEAIRLDPMNLTAFQGRAFVYMVQDRFDHAVELLGPAIGRHPQDHTLRLYRANSLIRLGRWSEALADLEVDLKNKESGPSYALASVAHAAEGRWKEAGEDVRNWGRLEPGRMPVPSVWFVDAEVALGQGDQKAYRQARDRLLLLADADPTPLSCALGARVCVLAGSTDIDPVRLANLIDFALTKQPGIPYHLHVRALVLLRTGKFESAVKVFQQSLEGERWEPSLNHLGLVLAHAKLRQKAEAQRALEQALKAGMPTRHPHDTLEYQILLPQARKALRDLDSSSP